MSSRLEREAQEWIEEITGVAFPGPTFADSLKDGIILCKCVAAMLAERFWERGPRMLEARSANAALP